MTRAVNEQMTNFACLKNVFRHGFEKHSLSFWAVAVITQLSLVMGDPLFDCEDYSTTDL